MQWKKGSNRGIGVYFMLVVALRTTSSDDAVITSDRDDDDLSVAHTEYSSDSSGEGVSESGLVRLRGGHASKCLFVLTVGYSGYGDGDSITGLIHVRGHRCPTRLSSIQYSRAAVAVSCGYLCGDVSHDGCYSGSSSRPGGSRTWGHCGELGVRDSGGIERLQV